eukprot:symbB.v1.2.040217.t1/scaffold7080.1/size13429/2
MEPVDGTTVSEMLENHVDETEGKTSQGKAIEESSKSSAGEEDYHLGQAKEVATGDVQATVGLSQNETTEDGQPDVESVVTSPPATLDLPEPPKARVAPRARRTRQPGARTRHSIREKGSAMIKLRSCRCCADDDAAAFAHSIE